MAGHITTFEEAVSALQTADFSHPNEGHPDVQSLIDYAESGLDQETTEHVRTHIVYCGECRQELKLLHEMNEESAKNALDLSSVDKAESPAGVRKEL